MKRIKLYILRLLTRKLLKVVTEDDILRITTRGHYIGRRKLTEEEFGILVQDAKDLRESVLWELMKKDIEWVATLRLGRKATTIDDIIYGNSMFYNLEMIEKYLDNLSTL